MSLLDFGLLLLHKAEELKYKPNSRQYISYSKGFGGANFQQIIGCTENEINEIKSHQNVDNLPLFYHQYLLRFGKQSGDIFLGFDADIYYLFDLKEDANAMLSQSSMGYELPESAFVFQGQQGHTFWYFLTAQEKINPPVYLISEITHEESPSLRGRLPYRDNHGVGWPHLSHFLSRFILHRAGEAVYNEFLQHVAQLR